MNRSPFFYGWVVWAVATLGLIGTSPGQSFTVSLFMDHFIADFGLDRTTASGLYGIGTFFGALSLTWIGRGVDRYGNRLAGSVISAVFALALIFMSFITGPVMLLIGFVAIRGLGQGAMGLVSTTVIAQWFQQHRGRMMSLMIVLYALFQIVYVPWLQRTLEVTDWRVVWLMLAAAIGLVLLPITWSLMRNRPEDFGLYPDGRKLSAEEANAEAEALLLERNYSLKEAMRTAIFWVFVIARLLTPAWATGLILHQISIFHDLGHSAQVAAQTYSMLAFFSAVSSLAFGVLVDRIRPGIVMVLELGALMLMLVMAMVMTETWMLVIYAMAFGVAMGSGGVFDGAVWPNLFGRKSQGEIRGFVATALVTGTSIGPFLFGLSYDYLGGYGPILWVGIALAGVLLVLSFIVPEPRRD